MRRRQFPATWAKRENTHQESARLVYDAAMAVGMGPKAAGSAARAATQTVTPSDLDHCRGIVSCTVGLR